MKKITVPFQITSCPYIPRKRVNDNIKLYKMLQENYEKGNRDGELTYEIIDKVSHGFHKWYRGYLLPTIAQDKDPSVIAETHLNLKATYLMEFYGSRWENIPDRFLKKGVAIISLRTSQIDWRNNCIKVPTGRTIITVVEGKPNFLIKSHAVLTKKEMQSFIRDCELIIEGLVDAPEPGQELLKYRDLVMKQKGFLKKQS